MFNTPQQVFDAMPAAFQPKKAGPVELALNFALRGDLGGEWGVCIEEGACHITEGQVQDPAATIRAGAQDFVAIMNRDLNAVAAYMSGRVRVTGDVTAIMNLLSFFDFPDSG